jgi:CheY-like chemotaxis protein
VTLEPEEAALPETKIVIADDHAVVRRGLRMLLDAEAGLEVVAEAGDVPSALRYVRAAMPAASEPSWSRVKWATPDWPLDGPGSLEESSAIGLLELALAAASVPLALALVVWPVRDAWLAAGVLCTVALGFYVPAAPSGCSA